LYAENIRLPYLKLPNSKFRKPGPDGVDGAAESTKPVDINEIVRDVREFLETTLLERMKFVGDSDPELKDGDARVKLAEAISLAETLRQELLRVLPESPFRSYEQVKPSPEAHYFIAKAKERAQAERDQKYELIQKTCLMLVRVFAVRMPSLMDFGDRSKDPEREKITAFASEHVTKSGLDVGAVISAFADKKGPYYIGIERPALEAAFRDKSIAEMVSDPQTSVFRAGVYPSELFEQLIHAKIAAVTMEIEKAWQSRKLESGKEQFILGLMTRARGYIGSRFKKDFLGDELRNCTTLPELQVFARSMPSDAQAYDLLRKSHLLLKVMHMMILHDSKVDQSSYIDNSVNLGTELDDLCLKFEEDGRCYINPPRDDNGRPKSEFEDDKYGMFVDRVEVAKDGKPFDSSMDKVIRKDLSDTTEVGDFARMRIFLTEEDCYDEQGNYDPVKTEKAIEKLFGIFLSRFGNDVDVKSLDWSVDSGKTNAASGGSHRGLHFNFKYKSTCKANGVKATGESVTRTIDVEVHLLAYMEKNAHTKDVEVYEHGKRGLLRNKLGLENGFEYFVLDLISAISNPNYNYNLSSTVDPFSAIEEVPEEFRKVHQRQLGIGDEDLFPESADLDVLMEEGWILHSPDKLRLFVLLLSILTKENEDGRLANANIFEYIECYFPGSLHRLIDQYSKLLRGSQFAPGGQMAYLKRVLEAKIMVVKNIKTNVTRNQYKCKESRPHEFTTVTHTLKVGKSVGRGHPKITFVSNFKGGEYHGSSTNEVPYQGPVGLVREEQADGKAAYFYWLMQDGSKVGPVYMIEMEEEEITCYLIGSPTQEEVQQLLPLWILQPDVNDGDSLSGDVYPYKHRLVFDQTTNRPMVVNTDIDSAKKQEINLKGGLERLTPSSGLDANRGRFLRLVEQIAPIWTATSGKKASEAREYKLKV
jgi:hypothetical protein